MIFKNQTIPEPTMSDLYPRGKLEGHVFVYLLPVFTFCFVLPHKNTFLFTWRFV